MKKLKLMSVMTLLFATSSALAEVMNSNDIKSTLVNCHDEINLADKMQLAKFTNKLNSLKRQAEQDSNNFCGVKPHIYNFFAGTFGNPLQNRGAIFEAMPTYKKCLNAKHNLEIHKKIAAALEIRKLEHEIADDLEELEEEHEKIDKAGNDEVMELFNQLRPEKIDAKSFIIKN